MRTIFVRSLQSVLAIATVALLTGANDAGCGLGTVISGGTEPTTGGGTEPGDPGPIACPSGTVLQLVCDPGTPGNPIPVDDCTGPNCPSPPHTCGPADPNCTEPFPGDPDAPPPPCDPADPDCSVSSPGGPDAPPPCDPATPGCTGSSPGNPGPPCNPADPGCVTPMPCEPGGPACPPPPPPPPPPSGCNYVCVPANQVCPPGTSLVTVCSGSSGGSEGTAGGTPPVPPGGPDTPVSSGACWTECAPQGCGGDTPSEPPQPGDPEPPHPGEPETPHPG